MPGGLAWPGNFPPVPPAHPPPTPDQTGSPSLTGRRQPGGCWTGPAPWWAARRGTAPAVPQHAKRGGGGGGHRRWRREGSAQGSMVPHTPSLSRRAAAGALLAAGENVTRSNGQLASWPTAPPCCTANAQCVPSKTRQATLEHKAPVQCPQCIANVPSPPQCRPWAPARTPPACPRAGCNTERAKQGRLGSRRGRQGQGKRRTGLQRAPAQRRGHRGDDGLQAGAGSQAPRFWQHRAWSCWAQELACRGRCLASTPL